MDKIRPDIRLDIRPDIWPDDRPDIQLDIQSESLKNNVFKPGGGRAQWTL